MEKVWDWARTKENQGHVDLLKHANTGCQYDDHGEFAEWYLYQYPGRKESDESPPKINLLDFPCNQRGHGCNDRWYLFEDDVHCGCGSLIPWPTTGYTCPGCYNEYIPTQY